MSKRYFDELANIQVAISTLREFNQYVLFPVSEDVLGNLELLPYFTSPLDSDIEKKVEKIVCIAAAKAVIDNPHIPEENKKQSALNTARDVREAMRYAKLEYLFKTKKLFLSDYMRRKRSIPIVKRIAMIKTAKDTAKIVGTVSAHAIVDAIAGPGVGQIVSGICLLWKILPKEVKEPIIFGTEDIVDKAKNTIKNCYEQIQRTEIGKKMSPLIQKMSDKAVSIKEKAMGIIDKIKSYKPY